MNIIRKKTKRLRKFFCKYINGTKGVISLFLALIMLPFSSTALILVESARYQNVIDLVNEMLDCIGLSSIADFDSYLENRFDLLAMSQETDPQTNYNKYLSANMPALNNSFSYSSSIVQGVYPLSDEGVLKSQLMEYSEVTVMAETLYNGLEVDKILDKLYTLLDVEDLNKMAEATTAVANVASSTADLINAGMDAKEEFDKYNLQLSEYKKAAQSFHTKSSELISALVTEKNNLAEDADLNDIYDVKAVKDAISACESARDTFKTEAGEMADAVKKMRDAITKLFTTMNKITENTSKAQTAIEKTTGTTLQEDCTTTASEWILQQADEITNVIKTTISSTYSEDMLAQARLLDTQKEKLGKVVCNKTDDGDSSNYYIDVNSSALQIKKDFPEISTDSVRSDFSSEMNKTINEMNQNKSKISDDQASSLGKLLDVAAELLKVTAFYDGALDAHVSPTAFYKYNSGDVLLSNTMVMYSLKRIVQSGQDFVDSLTEKNIVKKAFNALKAAANFLLGIGEFLVGIIGWVTYTCINIVKLVASGKEIYDTFLLSAYSVYNMPCRTTYETGSSLSGFKYNQIFTTMGGISGTKVTGSMSDLNTLMSANDTGSDPGFKGAETEYLLIGGDNELLNQSAAFFNLYMLRMILNLLPIFKNDQVKLMATSANIAGWVVYLALIIAEPMIDSLLLVNHQTVYLLKNQIYLTPGGLVLLLETLPKMTGLSDQAKKKISECLVAKNGKAEASGLFNVDVDLNYQEHMMVLLLLTTEQPKILSRMANLIQMETAQHYKDSYTFDLDKANTYLKATVGGTLNSMFDMKALTEGGPFTIKRTRLIGY